MRKLLFISSLIVLFAANALVAQDAQDPAYQGNNKLEVNPLGIGAFLGMTQLGGDFNEGSTYPQLTNNWDIGGGIFGQYFLGAVGDDILLFWVKGTFGFYPTSADASNPDRGTEATYKDNAMIIHADIQFEFFGNSDLRPFFTAGLGAMFYDPEFTGTPTPLVVDESDETATGVFPLGVGIAYQISPTIRVDFMFQKYLTFTDLLDRIEREKNDNLNHMRLGFTYFFED